MAYRKNIIICFLLLTSMILHAQELTVKSMEVSPMDISASQYRRMDKNGQPCGLVKVQLATSGVVFEGNVIGEVEYKTNEYWVYMPAGSEVLQLKHPRYPSLKIEFHSYDISSIETLTTYKIVVTMPHKPNDSRVGQDNSFVETITVNNNIQIHMIRVEGGAFLMGCNDDNAEDDEKPAHQVTVSTFFICETEVTQELWEAVMGNNPSSYKYPSNPVERVGWKECQKFIKKLNKLTGRKFRLPTEAEWEYAARGGNMSKGYKYSGSNNVDDVAWYDKNSDKKPHEVALKLPNELGLYDMSGNVREWCQDQYEYYNGKTPDIFTWTPLYTQRGGSWFGGERYVTVFTRYPNEASRYAYGWMGFRLAM